MPKYWYVLSGLPYFFQAVTTAILQGCAFLFGNCLLSRQRSLFGMIFFFFLGGGVKMCFWRFWPLGDGYNMWEVLGGWWGGSKSACQHIVTSSTREGRVLTFFSNTGSQIGSLFGSVPRYVEKEIVTKISFLQYYLTGWLVWNGFLAGNPLNEGGCFCTSR